MWIDDKNSKKTVRLAQLAKIMYEEEEETVSRMCVCM